MQSNKNVAKKTLYKLLSKYTKYTFILIVLLNNIKYKYIKSIKHLYLPLVCFLCHKFHIWSKQRSYICYTHIRVDRIEFCRAPGLATVFAGKRSSRKTCEMLHPKVLLAQCSTEQEIVVLFCNTRCSSALQNNTKPILKCN